jgi:hypothetical protein
MKPLLKVAVLSVAVCALVRVVTKPRKPSPPLTARELEEKLARDPDFDF